VPASPVFAWQSAERRFQDAYARFLTDEQFRQSVLGWCSGDDLIGDLSEADLGRLRSMDQDRVKLFATCLFSNRIAAIAEAFPLSVKMMADALPSLVRALDAQNVAVDTRKYPEAARFADFVLNGGHEGAHQLSDPVLALLQYELAALNLRVRPRMPAWPDSAIRSVEVFSRALNDGEDVRLVLNRNHALLTVGFDVEALRELSADAASLAQTETETFVLLHRGDNGTVQQKGLNHASAAAILMIDETRTFRELIASYAQWLGNDAGATFEEELKELCIGLCACGALGFETVPSGEKREAAFRIGGDAA
jgi:hypothetical protein